MRSRPAGALLCVLLLAGAATARAFEQELADAGFEHITFDGKRANSFALDDGTIRVASANGVSLIQRPVDIDLEANPVLVWRWRVDQGVPPTDLTRKGGDDRSLAIYVTFPYRSEDAGLFERIRRQMVEAFAGKAAPGRVISYVFGGRAERGDVLENPWFGDAGASVVLRPATTPSGEWHEEWVDVGADHLRIFGSTAERLTHIAISADSDDTDTSVRAAVSGLRFVPREGEPPAQSRTR